MTFRHKAIANPPEWLLEFPTPVVQQFPNFAFRSSDHANATCGSAADAPVVKHNETQEGNISDKSPAFQQARRNWKTRATCFRAPIEAQNDKVRLGVSRGISTFALRDQSRSQKRKLAITPRLARDPVLSSLSPPSQKELHATIQVPTPRIQSSNQFHQG